VILLLNIRYRKIFGTMALPRSYPRAASFAAILHLFSEYERSWLRQRVWGPMQTLITLFALVGSSGEFVGRMTA
jgi:hypothetical protein